MNPATQFDELFAKMRTTLQAVRTGTAPDPSGSADSEEPVETVGQSADGRVLVTFSGNRVSRVDIDPRLLQAGTDSLGEFVAEAVNAALDQLRSGAGHVNTETDTAALAERLDELQTESIRSMTAMNEMLTEAVQRISRSGR
ncbi:YbaB/EbfC family nucleoid-associated protein [Catenuloplanes japonicus]|uniref:YbaB/EbfC family nucleoid-associated protein n=1 Tax=Catenuloplanes japonicus TaxID=33876 RepID=UPI000689C549|nr:YbaB/EbfC family nucleoid-associated protein [Catenuloplanes japonicus]